MSNDYPTPDSKLPTPDYLRRMRPFLLLLLLLPFGAQAQKPEVHLFAGPQATGARYTIKNAKQEVDPRFGAMAGIGLKVPFENRLTFFPAVYYSMKGYEVQLDRPSFPPSELALDNRTRLHTIEIAPLLQFDLRKGTSYPFIRLGPSVDYALGGRERFTTIRGETIDRPMVFSFGDYGLFTAAINAHLGWQWSGGTSLFLHHARGAGSLNNADGGPQIRHRVLGLSLGWKL